MNATETYTTRRARIDEQIARIQDLLRDMDTRQSAEPTNWGYAGSAGHIGNQLNDILTHLTGKEH